MSTNSTPSATPAVPTVGGVPVVGCERLTHGFACLTRAPDSNRWATVAANTTFDRAMTAWAYTRLDWVSVVVQASRSGLRVVRSTAS